MKKIAVIGAGTMGLDIAQVFARSGYEVVVRDITDEIIKASEARLVKGLDKLVSKGKLDEAGKNALLGNISFTTDLALAKDVDLVVEAIIENIKIKKSIFAELASASRRPFSPPIPPPSPSPPWPQPPSAPINSSVCTSSTPQPS